MFLSSLSQHAKMLRNQRLRSLLFVGFLLGTSVLALNVLRRSKELNEPYKLAPSVMEKIVRIGENENGRLPARGKLQKEGYNCKQKTNKS